MSAKSIYLIFNYKNHYHEKYIIIILKFLIILLLR
jgi:hypothetical protein